MSSALTCKLHNIIARACRHVAASLAVVFALTGPAYASEEGKVLSNAIETGIVDWIFGGAPGPVLLAIPGFGEFFVASCLDGGYPDMGIRNKSKVGIYVLGGGFSVSPFATWDDDLVLQPGEQAILAVTTPSGGVLAASSSFTYQLASGVGNNRQVATVMLSGVTNFSGKCYFQGHALIHGRAK